MNHDIRLKLEGALLEKLLEKALQTGACFSDVRRTGVRTLVLRTDVQGAAVLEALCRRYGLDCRMLGRSGYTALKAHVRARWTLVFGLLLCVVLCVLFLSRIWLIDVHFVGSRAALGNSDEIFSTLSALEIRVGMRAQEVDAELLQRRLFAASDGYSFVGARRQGVRLLIEVAPETPSPTLYESSRARDLVAARDGVISAVRVHAGNACVCVGDTVRTGQVLILGEETIRKDTQTGEALTAPIAARGEILARCWIEGSAEGNIVSATSSRTGRSRVSLRLRMGRRILPISESAHFASEELERELLPLVGLFMPLEVERSTYYETEIRNRKLDPATLEERLTTLAKADALSKLQQEDIAYELTSFWTDTDQIGNTLRVRAVYEIYTDIAVTRDALIEEVY